MTTTFRTHDGRTLEQAASDLVAREVHLCLSSMVSTLAGGFSGDGSGSDLQNLAEQAYDLAAPVLNYEEAAREEGWQVWDGAWVLPDSEDFEGSYSDAESVCSAMEIEPHELEVFEHWAVSTWLAEKLQAAGERVDTDFAGLNVWARTTTGQAISSDAMIEQITREMHAAR